MADGISTGGNPFVKGVKVQNKDIKDIQKQIQEELPLTNEQTSNEKEIQEKVKEFMEKNPDQRREILNKQAQELEKMQQEMTEENEKPVTKAEFVELIKSAGSVESAMNELKASGLDMDKELGMFIDKFKDGKIDELGNEVPEEGEGEVGVNVDVNTDTE